MAEADSSVDSGGEPVPRRGGRPPQINREQIVAAARSVPRKALTMKAIADALGVTRKALHYHVGDRQGLLNLVVADLFESQLAGVELPDADWQAELRAFAHAFRDGILQVGVAATYVQLHGMAGLSALTLTERIVTCLCTAGFDETLARRSLSAITNVATVHAHIDVLKAQHGTYPQQAELTNVLIDSPSGQFTGLRRILAQVQAEGPDDQFEFELDLTISGLEALLSKSIRHDGNPQS
ncbi:MAG TPA: TetR/AcrR family transcriptional regulator C-terminal domain-containing protein [Mycobacterium sp.]|nr:TetR/AcrR family transcriptional regulator C-terminal domain-containing protein [Mycobacterium sp.]